MSDGSSLWKRFLTSRRRRREAYTPDRAYKGSVRPLDAWLNLP